MRAHEEQDDSPQTLYRMWSRQLYQEHANVLYRYKVHLSTPILRIEEMNSRWGSWDSFTRTITLSETLIRKHSWDIVIEILKHEMAHQYVSEHFGDDTSHGERFQFACNLFGIADWARTASGELPAHIPLWKDRVLSEEEERLLKRVEKLLALATSSNEFEALSAMQKVRELYEKYNLDQLEKQGGAPIVYTILNRKKKRVEACESLICSILTEFFFVKVVYSTLFDANDLCEYKVIEIFGTKENVLMAEYVYGFLRQQSHSLWVRYKAHTGRPMGFKNSYIMGVLSGFRHKLEENKRLREKEAKNPSSPQTAGALVALGDRQIEDFIATRYPRLHSRSWGRTFRDPHSFAAGVSEGKQLSLHKPISKNDGNRGLLLKP